MGVRSALLRCRPALWAGPGRASRARAEGSAAGRVPGFDQVGRLLRPVPNRTSARDDEGFDVPADFLRVRDYSCDGVRRSLESSLERLGPDRIDIAFVHDPDDFYKEALDSAFPALEELRAESAITSYRAGMNQSEMLTRFVERTDLDIVMLAGRYTLLASTCATHCYVLATVAALSIHTPNQTNATP